MLTYLKRLLLGFLLVSVLTGQALAADYCLPVTDADGNHQAGSIVYNDINNGDYPNVTSKTTRLVERYVKNTSPYGTALCWNTPENTYIRSKLDAGQISAIVSGVPAGYNSAPDYTKTPYFNEFDSNRLKPGGKAISIDSDSLGSSASSPYDLAEPDRLYSQLDTMLPEGSQVIGLGVGGKTVNQLITDFPNKVGTLNIPPGVEHHHILVTGCNDIPIDGQNGWGCASRIRNYVDTFKAAFPNSTIWVTTPMARLDASFTAKLRDTTVSLKDPANVTAKGYRLIDEGGDARFTPMTNANALENRDIWQSDNEHLTVYGTKIQAENIYNHLFPDPDLHPAMKAFGSFWFQKINTATATYTAVATTDNGPNTHHEPGLGYHTHYYGDRNRVIDSTESDPIKTFFFPGSFQDRDSGTTPSVFKARVPASSVVPDVIPSNTPNEAGWFYNKTTGVFMPANTICISTAGGNVWAYAQVNHAGSGGNALPLMKSELDAGLIKHALSLNVAGLRLYWDTSVTPNRGWLWPAVNHDAGANASTYLGVQSKYRLGTRVAIPPGVTAASLGLTDPDVITVFNALRDYGGFLVDTTSIGSLPWGWSIGQEDSIETVLDDNQAEMRAIAEALEVVENWEQ